MDSENTPPSPTRLRVLAAARTCFSRDGFHGASMKNICKASEISPGTLYHHFPSKEALVEAIIEEDQLRAFSRFAQDKPDSNLVETIVNNLLAVREEDRAQRALVVEIMAEGMRNPLVAEMLDRKHQAIMAMIESRLRQAQQQGAVAADLDLPATSSLLLSLTYGILADTATGSALSEAQRRRALSAMINGVLRPVG
ncbi:TetR/AcrR family transcriptional regulator [Pantoea coffeiphila]|uniref:TetR/AcrR family transcriptional regulator n=1 Tax=Pantoea coffeiphila TaxID=1465635 RepID=UPI00195F66CB|nr:TetR/AcrR family transcriptional regulator [Pantoea coffeiphila]MBM7343972.1 TetR/AcrR family transcriptional repressor of uid operon [Pantoea coffeiphila]